MAFIGSIAELEYLVQSTGKLQGKTAYLFNIIGRRTSFTSATVMNDAVEFSPSVAVIPVLTGAESLEIVSDNAQDDVGGTGVSEVKVTYLNGSNAITESAGIALDGVTPVAAGFTAKAILWMEATAVGSNTVAVGNIVLRVAGGAEQERITAGGNKSMSGRITVPAGFDGYLPSWCAASVNQNMDTRLRANVDSWTRGLVTPFHFQASIFATAGAAPGGNVNEQSLPFFKLPPLSVVKVSAFAGATTGSPRLDCCFKILLVAQ